MGTGPIAACHKCLNGIGWSVSELDLIESNEAFAAQAITVNRAMGWDTAKVNVNGGAISIGHPIGASGCRVLVTLLHELRREHIKAEGARHIVRRRRAGCGYGCGAQVPGYRRRSRLNVYQHGGRRQGTHGS